MLHSRNSTNDSFHSLSDYSDYFAKSHQLIQLVNQLRILGAQLELDLPTIVVSGNQSVGKSSIIEAISGIVLPKSEGTCTRCPIEIRMSSGGSFSCTIKMRIETDGGSVERVYKNTADSMKLEQYILEAQKILLNPSSKADRLPAKDELLFTKNVVCVELTGQDVDLTLIDLPGIIHNYHDARMITLVEELVKEYISKERALILAAITCKDEIENQAIFHYCRQVDPTGNRTIGIVD
jgi:GTP-binding protein EngB required for normal cell division